MNVFVIFWVSRLWKTIISWLHLLSLKSTSIKFNPLVIQVTQFAPARLCSLAGIFTAPVNGLYYFSFSTYGYNSHVMGAALMKNGIRQISTYDSPSADGSDSSSNAAVLQLAAGDEVYMELWDDGRVFDNLNGHTTFSGFLVFPA